MFWQYSKIDGIPTIYINIYQQNISQLSVPQDIDRIWKEVQFTKCQLNAILVNVILISVKMKKQFKEFSSPSIHIPFFSYFMLPCCTFTPFFPLFFWGVGGGGGGKGEFLTEETENWIEIHQKSTTKSTIEYSCPWSTFFGMV